MIALLDNMQILVISKKLVNKLHSVGPVTSLWLGVTQRITNAPINVKPHYPPPGLTKGLVGDFRRFDQKFCPTSGAFDRSKF